MEATISAGAGATLRLGADLGIGYGPVLASTVDEIELGTGTHFLLARNGRGKTTLLKTLSGLLDAVRGGYEIRGRCRFVADDLSFDRELPARLIFAAFLPKERRRSALELADRLELDVAKPFGKLSFGNRKKVGLVVAECGLGSGEVIFYDEPFTGLDTPARETLLQKWRESEGDQLRLVSCHPDLDDMAMPSTLLITDSRISRAGAGDTTWADLKKLLN